jgi:hypothetical protein
MLIRRDAQAAVGDAAHDPEMRSFGVVLTRLRPWPIAARTSRHSA